MDAVYLCGLLEYIDCEVDSECELHDHKKYNGQYTKRSSRSGY